MPDYRRAFCRECKNHRDAVGPISWRGLCAECGDRLLLENAHGISNHSGPAFHRWRQAMAASVGAVLLDDRREEG